MPKNNGKEGSPIIIVRKKGGHGHGHHGGSWKVALADFMTAMMAFFLLMWLLEAATPKELQAIAGYFQAAPASKYVVGPGGADASAIELKAALEDEPVMEANSSSPIDSAGVLGDTKESEAQDAKTETMSVSEQLAAAEIKEQLVKVEQAQLEQLKEQLVNEINNTDSALNVLKDQIRMEFTNLGLSIQIIDKERRAMFDEGSARLRPYAEDAILALAPIVNKVPNRISIVGHTDATPYGAGAVYSNWELSSDRANTARRALVKGKYPNSKVVAVQGLASVAPLLPNNPTDPSNRRIAIIVLKQEVVEAMIKIDPNAGPELLPGSAYSTKAAPEDGVKRVMSEQEIENAIEKTSSPK